MKNWLTAMVVCAGAALTVLGSGGVAVAQSAAEKCEKESGDAAIAACSEVILQDAKAAWAYNNRGIEWGDKGEIDKAISDYNEAIKIDPKYRQAYFNRGKARAQKGDLENAISDLSEAIKLNPKNAEAFANRGLVWALKHDLDMAISDLTEAIKLDSKDGKSFYFRGSVWAEKGDLDKAIADYNEAINLDPKEQEFYIDRGFMWVRKGDFGKAIADYNDAIKFLPKSEQGYRGRAYSNLFAGNFSAAASDFLQVNEIKMNSFSVLLRFVARSRSGHDAMGELAANASRLTDRKWAYPIIDFYLGRRSLEELNAAVSKPEERCEADYYLGMWYLLKDQPDASRTYFIAAARGCPPSFYEKPGSIAELKRFTSSYIEQSKKLESEKKYADALSQLTNALTIYESLDVFKEERIGASNELTRIKFVQIEADRAAQEAEQKRQIEEARRIAAEQKRQAEELQRKIAETERIAAEERKSLITNGIIAFIVAIAAIAFFAFRRRQKRA